MSWKDILKEADYRNMTDEELLSRMKLFMADFHKFADDLEIGKDINSHNHGNIKLFIKRVESKMSEGGGFIDIFQFNDYVRKVITPNKLVQYIVLWNKHLKGL